MAATCGGQVQGRGNDCMAQHNAAIGSKVEKDYDFGGRRGAHV